MYKLTPAGAALVRSFVDYHAAIPAKQNPAAWVALAERKAAAGMQTGVTIEMPASMTASGKVERIGLPRRLFKEPSHA
jgi:hypothetical protein